MAVSQIEERILGRLAQETESTSALLSASLYQVLGLSILLSRKLFRARKVRRLDVTRDTKSLQLYHHIIWLAREGLSITEVYVLPYCQDGEHGAECRVMAAKLRASFYHVFCLFHNHPPVSAISSRSPNSSPPSARSSKEGRRSPPDKAVQEGGGKRRGKSHLRDPIPSMTSDASYVTNPYAATNQTPPPFLADPTRRTPSRPPGLNIPSPTSPGAFLLPPLNFVPMARERFENAQTLANALLPAAHALRLSISLEHSAFIWDCEKEHERSRRLARRAIKEVYASTEGLDDDEFADASALVQALAGIIRRGNEQHRRSSESLRRASTERLRKSPPTTVSTGADPRNGSSRHRIDRTIAVSPSNGRSRKTPPPSASPRQHAYVRRTPDRLSTVPEVDSTASEGPPTLPAMSPQTSRRSSRGSQSQSQSRQTQTPASTASDKAIKRKAVERAEEEHYRRNSNTSRGSGSRASENSRRGSAQTAIVDQRRSSKSKEQIRDDKHSSSRSSKSKESVRDERHSSSRSSKSKEKSRDDRHNSSRSKSSSGSQRGREHEAQANHNGHSSRKRQSSKGSAGSRGSKGSRRSKSGNAEGSSGTHSRQATPPDGYVRKLSKSPSSHKSRSGTGHGR